MAQKYKKPMWQVPDVPSLGDDKSTIRGNARSYQTTQDLYLKFAQDVMDRMELL
jgi:hypothetical protein